VKHHNKDDGKVDDPWETGLRGFPVRYGIVLVTGIT